MAKLEKKVLFNLTADEKTWLSFANLALAEVSVQLENENADGLLNFETGEVIELSDISKAFSVIEYLLDGNTEVLY